MSEQNQNDGTLPIDRRSALKCVSLWAGTGVLWSLVGGVPKALAAEALSAGAAVLPDIGFTFGQISDTHIGFNKAANPDPAKTTDEAIHKLNGLKPSFILHTGDISHLSKAEEFDTAEQLLKGFQSKVYYVPGEHDTLDEGGGKLYLERFGRGSTGNGWYSFDDHGVHFVALVNVFNFKPGQTAQLGPDQIKWLLDDLKSVSNSTPIVVFSHIPLWTVYQPWGWGTEDGDQALALLRRFGSVTILNGHIHQIIQKVEGNMTFHTARGTAYPQPEPGQAPSPGPLLVPADQLRHYLGITQVDVKAGRPSLTDLKLA